jgi:hypothetical protein
MIKSITWLDAKGEMTDRSCHGGPGTAVLGCRAFES